MGNSKLVKWLSYIFLFFLLAPQAVFADVIYTQTDATAQDANPHPQSYGAANPGNLFLQKLGTGLNATVDNLIVKVHEGTDTGNSYTAIWNIREYNDATYTGGSVVESMACADAAMPTADETYTIDFKNEIAVDESGTQRQCNSTLGTSNGKFDGFTFNPAKYYAILDAESFAVANNEREGYLLGSTNANAWTTGTIGYSPTSLADMYFIFEGPFIANNLDTRSRIVEMVQPLTGSLTGSTTVSFEYDFYFNDSDAYTMADIELRDITSGQEMLTPRQAIVASGLSTYLQTMPLTAGHSYMWRAALSAPDGSKVYSTGWEAFDVLTPSVFSPQLDPEGDNATSSVAARFFGLQGYLAGKFPFAYIYDIAHVLQAVSTTTASSSVPTLTLTTGASSSVPIAFAFFSSSTISQFAGATTVSVFRTLMSAALWMLFATMIFFEVKHLLKH